MSGSPGQGKSVLCKHLLGTLGKAVKDKKMPHCCTVAYFFCSGRYDARPQTPETVLKTLIVQLLSCPHMFRHLSQEYQKDAGKFHSAPLASLWVIFRDMISDEYHSRIYCLIDAIDELESGTADLFDRIQKLRSCKRASSLPVIKFLVSSRPETEISRLLV